MKKTETAQCYLNVFMYKKKTLTLFAMLSEAVRVSVIRCTTPRVTNKARWIDLVEGFEVCIHQRLRGTVRQEEAGRRIAMATSKLSSVMNHMSMACPGTIDRVRSHFMSQRTYCVINNSSLIALAVRNGS